MNRWRTNKFWFIVSLVAIPYTFNAGHAAEIKMGDGSSLNVGLRLQGWGQWTENGAADGSDKTDFLARRAYFYVGGTVHPYLSYFAHIAGDRLGQDGLDKPGVGLGSGVALRDGWITLAAADAFKIQMGRMYVPFVRAYGTESTFGLMTLDVAQFQQGDMIPGRRVGRDDGATLWGNFQGGRYQYRLAVMDGADASGRTGSLRTAGRFSMSLLDPEKEWFTAGTYLESKRVLSIGLGFDRLNNFSAGIDHSGWTFDTFANLPFQNNGAATLEGAFAKIDQDDTRFTGNYYFATAGLLLPWRTNSHRFQPYVRYEKFDLDENVTAATADDQEVGGGINIYLFNLGQKAKITLDWTVVYPRSQASFDRATIQMQLSY